MNKYKLAEWLADPEWGHWETGVDNNSYILVHISKEAESIQQDMLGPHVEFYKAVLSWEKRIYLCCPSACSLLQKDLTTDKVVRTHLACIFNIAALTTLSALYMLAILHILIIVMLLCAIVK